MKYHIIRLIVLCTMLLVTEQSLMAQSDSAKQKKMDTTSHIADTSHQAAANHTSIDTGKFVDTNLRFGIPPHLVAVDSGTAVDTGITLKQNYPDPFAKSTEIVFQVTDSRLRGKPVSLDIYNMFGTKLQTLYTDLADGSTHSVMFSGASIKDGVYKYRVECAGRRTERIMHILPSDQNK